MAFPLKSGADLYNNQLIRAAIWNYSADIIEPSELVTGLIYFNTSNSSAGKKLRLYTGSAWKTLAFEEDLDVANNADFQTLKAKVEAFLEGGVDSDGVLNKLSEIQKFLDNYSSATDLTEILDTKLDKKGGTISGGVFAPLKIVGTGNRCSVGFSKDGSIFGYLTYNGGDSWAVTNEYYNNEYTLLHSGNYADQIGDYYLKTSGGVIAGTLMNPLTIKTSAAIEVGISMSVKDSVKMWVGWNSSNGAYIYNPAKNYYLGIKDDGTPHYNGNTLIHSGNVGEYKAGSATKLATPRTIWGQRFDGTGDVSGNITLGAASIRGYDNRNILESTANDLMVGFGYTTSSLKTTIFGNTIKLNNAVLINSSGNVTIGSSDLAGTSAKLFVDGTLIVGNNKSSNIYMQRGHFNRFVAEKEGGCFGWRVNGSEEDVMTLNTNGSLYLYKGLSVTGDTLFYNNVGIGTTDPQYKLHVGGDIVANGTIACKGIAAEGDAMDMVDKVVLHIVPNGNQQTFTLNHGLGTREITISIYEITSMGTNMILTDVEIVNDNSISVSFGNPPTENHMVVVMG